MKPAAIVPPLDPQALALTTPATWESKLFVLVLSASGTRIRLACFEYEYEYHFIEYEYDGKPNCAASTGTSRGHISSTMKLNAASARGSIKQQANCPLTQ